MHPSRNHPPARLSAVLVAPLVLLASACSSAGTTGDGPLVVVTHSLLGDVVHELVGDEADVEVLMPPGADPHEFEPSAAQVAELHEADLVVANGLGFEVGLLDALDAAASDGVPVLELGEDLDPLALEDHGHTAEQHRSEDEADVDPHWFTDPRRMAEAVGLMATAFEDLDGVDVATLADRAEAYAAELAGLDAEVATQLTAVPEEDRELITNHEALGYFADRYGFEIVGAVIPGGATLAEPSSAELADLLATIEDTGVLAIFADTSSPTELADMLAAETDPDIEVVELYSESLGPPDSDGATYLGLVRANADRIRAALT